MSPADTYIKRCSPKVEARYHVKPRPARYLPSPRHYRGVLSGAAVGSPARLWRHQSLGLRLSVAGRHVALATRPGSGKSLVAQTLLTHAVRTSTHATAILFFPTKALAADQFLKLCQRFEQAMLDPGVIGEINGDIPAVQREATLARCRVIFMTPDVAHAWLMPQLAAPSVQQFLRNLRFIVIDEAHAFEGIMGSNFAFLIRAVRLAVRRLGAEEPQFVATTGTIAEPVRFLKDLTGCTFDVIDERRNGAPSHGLTVLHVDGPAYGAPAEALAADMMQTLLGDALSGSIILFSNSRQASERISRSTKRDDIQCYRNGFHPQVRREIEGELRSGTSVVATSALELGIDISSFTYGFNLGLAPTLKSLLQRIGRVGRASEGVFVIIAPASTFAQLGTTLEEYCTGPVEPSPLYLGNPHIQMQQALCRLHESGGDAAVVDAEPSYWPAGFNRMLKLAEPGAHRPRDLDEIVSMGRDLPHYAFTMRHIGGRTFALKDHRNGETIGTIEHDKALREAPPGATYYHNRTPYRVIEWRTTSYDSSITVQAAKNLAPTQSLLRTMVSISFEPTEVLDNHLKSNADAAFAEIQLRVVESVEGLRHGSTAMLYRDMTDRRLTRKQREFGTTGIVLRIPDPWFAGSADHQIAARRRVCEALQTFVTREYGISPTDVRTAHSGMAIYQRSGARRIDDAIVIFDAVQGGLRLTSPLYRDFSGILDRLERAATLAGSEALLGDAAVSALRSWHGQLHEGAPLIGDTAATGDELLIYAPGSTVGIRFRGQLLDRRIIEPQFVATSAGEQLMYRYELSEGAHGWVAHDQIEPVGHDWQRVLWNPLTNHMKELIG